MGGANGSKDEDADGSGARGQEEEAGGGGWGECGEDMSLCQKGRPVVHAVKEISTGKNRGPLDISLPYIYNRKRLIILVIHLQWESGCKYAGFAPSQGKSPSGKDTESCPREVLPATNIPHRRMYNVH